MAWAVGIRNGTEITVGDHCLRVVDAHPKAVAVRIDDGPPIVIIAEERTEVLPEVFVFLGESQSVGRLRLAFEAPQSIRLKRKE
jgi:hypothetical protein